MFKRCKYLSQYTGNVDSRQNNKLSGVHEVMYIQDHDGVEFVEISLGAKQGSMTYGDLVEKLVEIHIEHGDLELRAVRV